MKGLNKELILKYKSEFDSWLKDEKSIIMGYNKSKTLYIEIEWLGFIDWTFDRGIFILNDEYVELRKALAEGKTIQLNEAEKFSDPKRGWVDLSCTDLGHSRLLFPVSCYRIKPEESKFKVGDWVCNPATDSVPCQFSEDMCSPGLALWEPKMGERCWFSDNLYEEPILSILTGVCYINQQKDKVHKYYTEYSDCNGKNFYKICQPFICVLPIGMKKLK